MRVRRGVGRMPTSVEGIYRGGKVELAEPPGDLPDGTPVIVTFLRPGVSDPRSRGIDETGAAELRARPAPFAENGGSPEMAVYDDYDAANAGR